MNTIAGSPELLRRGADAMNTQAGRLEGHASCVSSAASGASAQWRGAAATEFTCAVTTHNRETRNAARVLRDAAGAVRAYAGDLERHQGEQRRIVADLRAQKVLLRELELDRQLALPGDDPLSLSRQISATSSQIKRLYARHDQVSRDHRLSISRLRSALDHAQPPEVLWRKGARISGLGWSYYALWSQGKAAKVLWHTREGANPTAAQLAARKDALVTVQKGGASGLAEKDRVKVFLDGKGRWLKPVAKAAGRVAIVEAAAPGVIDIWTGGGYSGWRGGVTRYMGMVQVNGVVVSRLPGGQLAGAVAIAAWAAWKAGNKTHDDKDWVKNKLSASFRNGQFGLAGQVLSRARFHHHVAGKGTVSPAATQAVSARRLKDIKSPSRLKVENFDIAKVQWPESSRPTGLSSSAVTKPCRPAPTLPGAPSGAAR